MNKAIPWNISGVGFDARETAREAARRQGKSLGEWLHGVIADHAAELGIDAHDVAEQERIDAVTDKLERLSGRSADLERRTIRDPRGEAARPRAPRRADWDEDDEPAPRRLALRRDRETASEPRRPRRPSTIDDTEFLLDDAIEAMERRAARTDRRTEDAFASVTKLLEASEAKRDVEREAVRELAQKLTTIEAKLTDRAEDADEQTPIKGALSRLEARLETISRRSSAEGSARQLAARTLLDRRVDNEPIQRLEEKLNSILAAVAAPTPVAAPLVAPISAPAPAPLAAPVVPAPPMAAAAPMGAPVFPPAPAPLPTAAAPARRLGDAIAEIAKRQRTLDGAEPRPVSLPPTLPSRLALARDRQDDGAWKQSLMAMQTEIGSLASKIDDMRRDVVQQRAAAPVSPPVAAPMPTNVDLDDLRAEIGSMSQTLRELAPRGSVTQLQESIDALTRRVVSSRNRGVRETVLRPIEAVIGDLRQSLPSIDPRPTIGLIEREVKAIGDRVDSLAGANNPALSRLRGQMQEIRGLLSSAAATPLAVEDIQQQVSALTAQVDRAAHEPTSGSDLAAAIDGIRAMIAATPGKGALDKIEARLDQVAQKLDALPVKQSQEADKADKADVAGLERLVRDLGRKIEAVQAPGADTQAVEALQRQIERLAARFDKSEAGLASLGNLERSMVTLFDHLEQTRARVETSAVEAAREVVRTAIDDGRDLKGAAGAADVAALKTLQAQADERTQSTLNAVHQTLEHVVDRMSAMETDLAHIRRAPPVVVEAPPAPVAKLRAPAEPRPAPEFRQTPEPRQTSDSRQAAEPAFTKPAAPKPSRPMPDLTLPGIDALHEPLFSAKPRKPQAATGLAAGLEHPASDDDAGRADFIAAARRAAQAAQTNASVLAFKQPAATATVGARADLLAKSRDYVATHKRPVLLSVAAVFVVLGTMAIVQRMTFDSSDDRMAAQTVPAATRVADAAPANVGVTRGDLTPSALPTSARAVAARIPGSDPIQTSSIQTSSISGAAPVAQPAFAAPGMATARSGLPSSLVTMAESGNGAAEFELASRYADGKGTARDFQLAAEWYAKAAEQGLAPAQYRLAALYEKGLGLPPDKERAKALYMQAAQAGNPRAMHNLAVLLADGNGKPDYAGAATWFRKAAQYGVHDSQYNLAILLARGLGVSQSLVQSYQWFAVAAQQNDSDAAKKRDEVGDKLNANDLALAKALAASFQPATASMAATNVASPPGGWDSVSASSQINSGRTTISAL